MEALEYDDKAGRRLMIDQDAMDNGELGSGLKTLHK